MSEISNYLENALINGTLRATTFTAPAAVYVSLHTADPTDAGTGTEVSGGSYNGASTTTADITYPQATASYGTVTHIGIFDALTTGNLLYHSPLNTSKTIDTGDIFKITSGSLTVTLA